MAINTLVKKEVEGMFKLDQRSRKSNKPNSYLANIDEELNKQIKKIILDYGYPNKKTLGEKY